MIMPYLRVTVTDWHGSTVFASPADRTLPQLTIHCGGDLSYISGIVSQGMEMNLIGADIDRSGDCTPNLIVVCPDYLIDISSLAACFREYGHHPLNWFVGKIQPKRVNQYTLLGNLASQMLDDCVNETPERKASYKTSLLKFFPTAALDFCTSDIPQDFHARAMSQMDNIRDIIGKRLPLAVPGFRRDKTLLEASFICERLGLQGRADMMQTDCSILIEQKSGKRDEYRHAHKEDHYVQMMLYQAVMECNFGVRPEEMRTFLLYSKYPDGLTEEHPDERLLRECMRLRNEIVAQEIAFAEGAVEVVTECIDADMLNTAGARGKLWACYQRPQLNDLISVLKQASQLEKAYFCRMFTFLSREVLLSKTGGAADPSHGFAGTWRLPLADKLETGGIIMGLTVADRRRSSDDKGYDIICLKMPPDNGCDCMPNFRKGDLIMLYPSRGASNAMTEVLMKGMIQSISTQSVVVRLRYGQQNKDVMCSEDGTYSIEHDYADSTATNAFRGLYAFLEAERPRRELLLCRRTPETDSSLQLRGEYGTLNHIVLQEKRQRNCYLLIGPPGTGKTSCALRCMVEEALSVESASVLLMAYTNRAVDEICDMLVSSGIADRHRFIRLGNELSADSRFAPYMLQNCLGQRPTLDGIRRLVSDTRIFVSTTTTAASRINLFSIKRFDTAFIDEASQILEPDLIGILSAKCGKSSAIGKFVLIGDYKQLPAVTLQSAREAAVDNPLLKDAIGLTDCRHSLFERLCRMLPAECIGTLNRQGRMHPDIAEFTSMEFYPDEHISAVLLPHQTDASPYRTSSAALDELDSFLYAHRMVLMPVKAATDMAANEKANIDEARIVARLLDSVRRLTGATFDAGRSVGVIVPYRSQIAMIRHEMSALGLTGMEGVSIDTVERFQGSQRDVIIYSFTVRHQSQLSFLTESAFTEGGRTIDRKLNVALTRARRQIILTGDTELLSRNPVFRKLICYIRGKGGEWTGCLQASS